MNFNG
jgi:hypothetical protein